MPFAVNNNKMSSLVSAEARILSVSKTIIKEGATSRKELFVITSDRLVYRLTLWPPKDSMEFKINDWIYFERLALVPYIGNSLTTKSYSKIENLGQRKSDCLQPALKIIGGISFSNLNALKSGKFCGQLCFSQRQTTFVRL